MCHLGVQQSLLTVSPTLRVEKDLALQWQLRESERTQGLSGVSDLNEVQSRLKDAATGVSAGSSLKLPMVLCNLVMLSCRSVK